MLQITVSRRHLMVFTVVIAVVVLVVWVVMSDRVSAATSQFDDVPDSNVFVSDINWLADAGVTRGCNPPSNTKYCPSDYVTREQMSAFMHRLSGGDNRTIDGRLDTLEATVAALTAQLDTLESQNAALKATLTGVSRNGTTLLFTGMNLQIVNGEGKTDSKNTLGNVIIGYNEADPSRDRRTGSHYLVVGPRHSYESYGGIVVGDHNQASGPYASVSGGQWNSATGPYASVSGGDANHASGPHSSISGGLGNGAYGDASSVSGGNANIASGDASSVSGGFGGHAAAWAASILGGNGRTVPGDHGTYPFCGC